MGRNMKRRVFMTGIGAVLTSPIAVRAQQTTKRWRIAHIIVGSPDTSYLQRDNFRQGLAEAGYEDGRNIKLNHHFVEPQLAH
jgi:hypothetical protein